VGCERRCEDSVQGCAIYAIFGSHDRHVEAWDRHCRPGAGRQAHIDCRFAAAKRTGCHDWGNSGVRAMNALNDAQSLDSCAWLGCTDGDVAWTLFLQIQHKGCDPDSPGNKILQRVGELSSCVNTYVHLNGARPAIALPVDVMSLHCCCCSWSSVYCRRQSSTHQARPLQQLWKAQRDCCWFLMLRR